MTDSLDIIDKYVKLVEAVRRLYVVNLEHMAFMQEVWRDEEEPLGVREEARAKAMVHLFVQKWVDAIIEVHGLGDEDDTKTSETP